MKIFPAMRIKYNHIAGECRLSAECIKKHFIYLMIELFSGASTEKKMMWQMRCVGYVSFNLDNTPVHPY